MELLKASWINDGDDVRILMPFAKVDTENRTVSGFATVNNVDQSNDVVTSSASEEAFMTFRGNIREMHQPIAAGRMISFSQAPYYDEQTGKTYLGIYVTVYVSKGAQDTWEKVLDKTLSGFSIGGHIIEQHSEYVPDLAKTVRFITQISLFELSLVDNPANQFANILSIQKVDGELIMKGIAAEMQSENVFWCDFDRIARSSSEGSEACIECSAPMTNIGWIEITDSKSSPEELKKFVDGWVEKVITSQQIKESSGEKSPQQNAQFANEEKVGDNNPDTTKRDGGVNMSDVDTVEKALEVDEIEDTVEKSEEAVATTDIVEKAEEIVAEPVETVEKSEEAATPEFDVTKVLDEVKNFVSEAVTKSATEQATSVEEITKAVAALAESMAKLAPLAEAVANVGERLENLERSTAVKKSGEEVESEPVKKGFSWGGHFASASTITQ